MKINKILIANRGEIALRIIRACKELRIRTVAVYSDADRFSPHVFHADEAYRLGAPPASESYLKIEKIIEIADRSGSDAIHPGYGFLSENPEFAKEVEDRNLIFIGPSPETITTLGDKTRAKSLASKCGVDPIPGSPESLSSVESAVVAAKEIGFPVLLKAASGGGGKGIRIVRSAKELPEMFETASSEAYSSFNDPALFIERYIESPHHVEFQILGDKDGNVVHLGDRECSVQRRYQKVIEESPSPFVPDKIREEIGSYAVEIAKSAGYYSAGTVEFIVDNKLNFYFLEMNTRLQVEHPVTEMRTGVDIVKEQINIAEGNKLPFGQHEITYSGHSIECRITAEDALNDFMPDSGSIDNYIEPGGPGIRIDSGVQNDSEISPYYDPLISKLIAWGNDRVESIARCRRALSEYIITGISTSIPFCVSALMNDKFVKGDYDTDIAGEIIKEMPSRFEEKDVDAAAIGAAAYTVMNSQNGNVNESAGQSIFKSWKMHGRKSALR